MKFPIYYIVDHTFLRAPLRHTSSLTHMLCSPRGARMECPRPHTQSVTRRDVHTKGQSSKRNEKCFNQRHERDKISLPWKRRKSIFTRKSVNLLFIPVIFPAELRQLAVCCWTSKVKSIFPLCVVGWEQKVASECRWATTRICLSVIYLWKVQRTNFQFYAPPLFHVIKASEIRRPILSTRQQRSRCRRRRWR